MSSVDNRVVNMQFNNAQFQSGVAQTMASLDALNKSLKLEGAAKGFHDLDAAANKTNLNPLAAGVQAIADKFKALSIVGITALSNITTAALHAGTTLVKSLTVDPVIGGLREYETNLNSIQTILANTQVSGTGLLEVNKALDELNHYSDQTIYNFSEMARNIGTFTAAGVDLKTSVEAIKGIANLAALSGSNAQQASTAMYQLSQAIASGRVSLEDWNSVVNAGMGGTVFQRALAETAVAMGVIDSNVVKLTGSMKNVSINGQSFRDSIMAKPGEKSWLTSEVLLNTLKQFTGDLSDAQLKAMGFKDAQIASIQQMAETAKHAATEVKTMSALLATAREAAGSGWAETWRIIFGDFAEAKGLFTGVSNAVNDFIGASSDARNNVLADWKELGGRTSLIYAIKNAFDAVIAVIKPIRQAFRQIFPATTGKQLMDITTTIRMFTERLIISGVTADKLQHTFAGVFALFGIGFDIVKELAKVLFDLFGIAGSGAGDILDVTASIGDFLVYLRLALKSGEGFHKFFENLGRILAVPIRLLLMAGEAIGNLFDKFDGGDAANKVTGFVGKLSPIARVADAIINAWERVPELVSKAFTTLLPFAQKVGAFFASIGDKIADAMQGANFSKIFDGLASGGLAAVLLAITSFIMKLRSGTDGILEAITEPFNELTNTLQTMQTTLRATTLLQIAAAIALLAVAVVALSKVNAEGLTRALTAIAVMFGELAGALYIFEKVTNEKDIANMIALGAALVVLSIAVNILASAVTKLAALDWNGLAKGLTGVVALLGAMVGVVYLMPNEAKLIGTSAAMILLATAVKVLASAVSDLAGLSWEELAKGLIGVGVVLGALTLFTKFAAADKGGVLQGAGLLILAAAIKILASALSDLGNLSWIEIARGLTAMAGGLALMAGALYLLPPTSVLSAAAILVVATSLGLIGDALEDMSSMSWMEIARGMTAMAGALALVAGALILIPPSSLISAAAVLVVAASLSMIGDALKDMASMSWEEIAKGLIALAGSLAIIAGALYLMTGALPGAAALIVVAASLAILAPVLQMFGQMSWEEMGKGLLMLAGVFLVLGVAGAVLTPVVPTLIGLGAAILLLGVGTLAAGVGLLAFSAGLTALSIAGVAGTAALVGAIAALAGLIPLVLQQVAIGILRFAEIIGTGGPAITAALTTVLLSLMNAIDTLSPKIIATLYRLMELMLNTMLQHVPKMTDTGLKILIGFLNGVAKNIGGVVKAGTDVVVAYINGVASNTGKVVQAGINLIIAYVNALADGIRNNQDRMNAAGRNLASAIIDGMTGGLFSGAGKVAQAAREVAARALQAAKNFLGVKSPSKEFFKLGAWSSEGMALGIDDKADMVEDSSIAMGDAAIDSLTKTLAGIQKVIDGSIDYRPRIQPVLDLTDIRQNASQIGDLLATKPISVDATYSQARSAASGYQQNQDAAAENSETGHSETTIYNQYNSSPKALSAAEIYRQTKNQLSKVKGEVTT